MHMIQTCDQKRFSYRIGLYNLGTVGNDSWLASTIRRPNEVQHYVHYLSWLHNFIQSPMFRPNSLSM